MLSAASILPRRSGVELEPVMHGRARVLAGFAAFGTFWGAWGATLPAVQQAAGASDAELGIALLLVGAGALTSMRATGAVINRRGDAATAWAVGAFGLCAVLPALARSPGQLAVALLALGAASGAMDVAINAEGVHEEAVSQRPVLNLAHATFSAMVVAASLAAGGLRAAGAGPEAVLGLAGVAVLAAAVSLARSAPRAGPLVPAERGGGRRRVPAALVLLGVLCALAYWVENAWQSWSAVHLERDLAATAGISALGPAAFASAAVLGRLAGQRLVRTVPERALIATGAAVAAAGTAIAATASGVPVGLAGIVLAGLGTAVCAPTIISLAGAAVAPAERGTAVSTVTTIGYLGFLVGPAAVGGLAAVADLRVSLAAVAGIAAVLAVAALLVIDAPGTRASAPAPD
jgi:predicted MFS family arabinose efflux permease